MDTVILNAGHSQLEEQLKIAAACGVAEKNANEENADVDVDDDAELTVDDTNEGAHDHSMTSSSSDHDDSSPDSPPPSNQRLLGDEFVKTLEQISKQQAAQLATNAGEAHVSQGGNYRTELKRPDLKGTFRCSICQKIFCHSSSLSRHRMQAHFKSYTCTLCRKEITSTTHNSSTQKAARMRIRAPSDDMQCPGTKGYKHPEEQDICRLYSESAPLSTQRAAALQGVRYAP